MKHVDRFDALVVALAPTTDRRGAVKALLGGGLALAGLAGLRPSAGEAKNKKKKKNKKKSNPQPSATTPVPQPPATTPAPVCDAHCQGIARVNECLVGASQVCGCTGGSSFCTWCTGHHRTC